MKKILMKKLKKYISRIKKGIITPFLIQHFNYGDYVKINLCSGNTKIPGYCGIDLDENADLIIDLARKKLPFRDHSLNVVICISGINYFSYQRGYEIIKETARVLKPGGVARFATQDMKLLARYYVDENLDFFNQKKVDGDDRFKGQTLGDKFVAWFYGFPTAGGNCKYFYDYGSLEYLFKQAGYSEIERKAYTDSRLQDISLIDNRPDQMFFLEAVK
jgi:predicted SAM-dependent methyltransferase